jgi:hypothetical protein
MLRNFLYLDVDLVLEFWAQIEGGLSLAEEVRVQRSGTRGAGGQVRVGPVGVDAGADSGVRQETERKIEQTPASLFDKLYRRLESDAQVQALAALDKQIWDQLRRGEILDIDAVIALTGFAKVFDLAARMQQLAQVASVFDQPFDQDAVAAVSQINSLAALMESDWIPIIASVVGAPQFKFLARLQKSKLLVDRLALEGEAVLFGKIQRILRPREELPVADLMPGWAALPAEKRKELEASLRESEVSKFGLGEFSIRAPGAVVTPVAIYR